MTDRVYCDPVYCDLEKGTWCIGMDATLQPGGRVKGLSLFETFNTKTFERSARGVVYRKTAHDKGLVLNRCPWCGSWINMYREEEKGR